MNINEIIEFGGQGMYRRLEYTAIHNLYKKNKKLIILTGGSVVSEKETFNFLSSKVMSGLGYWLVFNRSSLTS